MASFCHRVALFNKKCFYKIVFVWAGGGMLVEQLHILGSLAGSAWISNNWGKHTLTLKEILYLFIL